MVVDMRFFEEIFLVNHIACQLEVKEDYVCTSSKFMIGNIVRDSRSLLQESVNG